MRIIGVFGLLLSVIGFASFIALFYFSADTFAELETHTIINPYIASWLLAIVGVLVQQLTLKFIKTNQKIEQREVSQKVKKHFDYMANLWRLPNGGYTEKWSEYRLKRNMLIASIVIWGASSMSFGPIAAVLLLPLPLFFGNVFMLFKCPKCGSEYTTGKNIFGESGCANCGFNRYDLGQ